MRSPHVSLVYYRAGNDCIERVTVVDSQAQVQKLSLLEALNVMADLATVISRAASKEISPCSLTVTIKPPEILA